jgi:hypothetical protein
LTTPAAHSYHKISYFNYCLYPASPDACCLASFAVPA